MSGPQHAAARAHHAPRPTHVCVARRVRVRRQPLPPMLQERINSFEGVAYARFEPPACTGDTSWLEDF